MTERLKQNPIDLHEQGYEFWKNVANDKPRLGRLLPEILSEREFGFQIVIQSGAFYSGEIATEEINVEPSKGSAIWIMERDGKNKLNVIRFEVEERRSARMVDDAAQGIVKESFELITGRDRSKSPISESDLSSLYLLAFKRKMRLKGFGRSAPVIDVDRTDLTSLESDLTEKGVTPLTVSQAKGILRGVLRDVFSTNSSLRQGAKFDWDRYRGPRELL